MRFRRFVALLFLGILLFWCIPHHSTDAINSPDLLSIRFSDLGPGPDGLRAEDSLTIGDFQSLGFGDLTVRTTLASSGQTPEETPLTDYKLATGTTVNSLIQATPGLREMPLKEVEPIYALYRQHFPQEVVYIPSTGEDFTVSTVADAVYVFNEFGFSEKLDNVDISRFTVADVPGLADARVGDFDEFRDALLSQIPGIINTAFANAIPIDYLVNFDIPYGMSDPNYEEHGIGNAASGTLKKRSWDCPLDNDCAHIEVKRRSGSTEKINWMSGNSQDWLPAGWGAGKAICSKEPTGRFPFGSLVPAKVVLTDIDEAEGKAEFAIYFRKDLYAFGAKIGATAHCFGPFPMSSFFSPVKEKGLVLFGPDKDVALPFKFPISEFTRGVGRTLNGGNGSGPEPTLKEKYSEAKSCKPGEPYQIPTTGTFTSGFGKRWGRNHNGIDIANDQGTPIYASNCGVVDYYSTSHPDFGNIVSIYHGSNITLYAHMQYAPLVKKDEKVFKGQLIGYMGSTGRSTGPHLHFEFHLGGYPRPVNPLPYLKDGR